VCCVAVLPACETCRIPCRNCGLIARIDSFRPTLYCNTVSCNTDCAHVASVHGLSLWFHSTCWPVDLWLKGTATSLLCCGLFLGMWTFGAFCT
jgi:hypothetical protein